MKQQKMITMIVKKGKTSSNKCGKCIGDDGCLKTKRKNSKHAEDKDNDD